MKSNFLSIQNIGSDGLEVELIVENGRVVGVNGVEGVINGEGRVNSYQIDYFKRINTRERVTQPMLQVDGEYVPIGFKEAFDIINERIKMVEADENLFLVSSTLTNEEMYSIQKLARQGVGTNNIHSIQYWNRSHLKDITDCNVALWEIEEASNISISNSALRTGGNECIAQRVEKAKLNGCSVFEDTQNKGCYRNTVNEYCRALIERSLFDKSVISNIPNFEEFKSKILGVEYSNEKSLMEAIESISREKTIFIFHEDLTDIKYINEAINYTMLKGQLGQLCTGVLVVRAECNSEGVFDMGCIPTLGVGRVEIEDHTDHDKLLLEGRVKNAFVFDNMNRSLNEINLKKVEFVVHQSAFIDKHCDADLIIPSSFHYEIGGTFTNTCHNIQKFDAVVNSPLEYNSLEQYAKILRPLGIKHPCNDEDIFMEIIAFLKKECHQRLFTV